MKLQNVALPAVLLSALLCGCVISSSGRASHSGQYVSAATFEQIEAGKSKEYVLALLGDPTTKTSLDDGVEIWKWRYTESRSSSGHIFLLLDASSSKDEQHNTFVEFEHGVVAAAWRD